MSDITLGVMTLYIGQNRNIEEKAYFQKLTHIGQQLGVKVVVFTPQDVEHSKKQVLAYIHTDTKTGWQRQWLPLPNIIYDRCRFQPTPRFMQFRKFRQRYGSELTFMNRPLANKWGVHQSFSTNPEIFPHLPDTKPYTTFREFISFLRKYKLVYLKPINGTGGRGIMRIETIAQDRVRLQGRDQQRRIIPIRELSLRHLAGTIRSLSLQDRYLMQEGINLKLSSGSVHDYRMLIQKNGKGEWDITGCVGRVGAKDSVTSNLHGGGKAIPMRELLRQQFLSEEQVSRIERDMNQISFDVADDLENKYGKLCEIGLDLAVDPKGHVWLIEINPKPARQVFARIGDKQAYQTAISRPIEYALWLAKNASE